MESAKSISWRDIGSCVHACSANGSICPLDVSMFLQEPGHSPFNMCFWSVERAILGDKEDKW